MRGVVGGVNESPLMEVCIKDADGCLRGGKRSRKSSCVSREREGDGEGFSDVGAVTAGGSPLSLKNPHLPLCLKATADPTELQTTCSLALVLMRELIMN